MNSRKKDTLEVFIFSNIFVFTVAFAWSSVIFHPPLNFTTCDVARKEKKKK